MGVRGKVFYNGGYLKTMGVVQCNWYRCLDIYWERTAHLIGKKITQPVYFLAGKNDPTTHMVRKAIQRLPQVVEDLRAVELFDNCGHWISCEQTELLNEKLVEYIGEVVGMK